jgi:hypothetical protein
MIRLFDPDTRLFDPDTRLFDPDTRLFDPDYIGSCQQRSKGLLIRIGEGYDKRAI